MKKCPYCAEEIQDEAIVCRFCGRDLVAQPEKPAYKPAPIPEPSSPAPGSAQQPIRMIDQGKRNAWKWILILLIIVGVAVCVIVPLTR